LARPRSDWSVPVNSSIADTVSLSITVDGRGRGSSLAVGGCGTRIRSDTLNAPTRVSRALIE
jgi:hypothetical protein